MSGTLVCNIKNQVLFEEAHQTVQQEGAWFRDPS